MSFGKVVKSYCQDESGQYAIMTAILAIPMLLGTSAAMDYSSATSEHKSVKDALDNAVIAAATNNNINDVEKEKIAELHFKQNYDGRAAIKLTSHAANGKVELSVEGLVPFSVSDALGLKGIEIRAKSAAARQEENVICVLALSEDAEEAIKFSGEGDFFAPNCSVHTNSKAGRAIVNESSKAPVAKSFCATGGVRGSFSPYAKGECLPVLDPYKNVLAPTIGQCDLRSMLSENGVFGSFTACVQDERLDSFVNSGGENFTGNNAVLKPGTYCGGIVVDGRNVEFMPGDYIIKDGPLLFLNGAEASGTDVTFGFVGKSAVLNVVKGADVNLKAPVSGPRKGLVFMQMQEETFWDQFAEEKQHEIASGGKLNILGTAYFPNQTIRVMGSGTEMGAEAPATSFIAKTLVFEGEKGSRIQVQVDHQKAGLPPIQPRAEDGAVLVE